MYKLIKDSTVLAIKSSLLRCKMQSNGVIIISPDGDGLIVDDTIYNLPGYEYLDIEEVNDIREVISEQVDTTAVSIAFVTLAETGNIDEVTAAEHSALFAEWAVSVKYSAGQFVRSGGVLYRCVQEHTSQENWRPDDTPALWTKTGDPAEEWPAWSQPIGAHDSYSAGDKVTHSGKHWISGVDANVWEPGVFGWEAAAQ